MATKKTTPPDFRKNALNLLEFSTKHLAALTALVILVSMLAATVFVASYLSVFDKRLILFLEYGDIVKGGFVALGIMSGFAGFIQMYVDDALVWYEEKQRWAPIGLLVIWAFSLAAWLWATHSSISPRYGLTIFAHLSAVAIGFVTLDILHVAKGYPNFTARALVGDITRLIIAVWIIGHAVGYYMRDTDGFDQQITLKSGDQITMGLVMVTSQFVLLHANDRTVAVALSEISQMLQSKNEDIRDH